MFVISIPVKTMSWAIDIDLQVGDNTMEAEHMSFTVYFEYSLERGQGDVREEADDGHLPLYVVSDAGSVYARGM
jgi:hypothetical protein